MSAQRTKVERIESARDAVNAATEEWITAAGEVAHIEENIAAATAGLTIALAKAEAREEEAEREVNRATRLLEGA